eukprot:m.104180 g.104180  ORF g.104180 m.104180 type:complete len:313 (-) comp15745_c0_seq1:357-1295(-)
MHGAQARVQHHLAAPRLRRLVPPRQQQAVAVPVHKGLGDLPDRRGDAAVVAAAAAARQPRPCYAPLRSISSEANTLRPPMASMQRYLNQSEAEAIDIELFNEYKFSVDQLMELAGLSVAHAMYDAYPPTTHARVLVCVGPGNNGGDALVAARHMKLMGYEPTVLYPKRTKKELYENLLHQVRRMGIEDLESLPGAEDAFARFDLILDGIFGFSFKGEIRAPFDALLPRLNAARLPIMAIDIPSGWDVEKGPVSAHGLAATGLVSLTAPKLCAKHFTGPHHYLGGRFVPPALAAKYRLDLPPYPGVATFVRLQ